MPAEKNLFGFPFNEPEFFGTVEIGIRPQQVQLDHFACLHYVWVRKIDACPQAFKQGLCNLQIVSAELVPEQCPVLRQESVLVQIRFDQSFQGTCQIYSTFSAEIIGNYIPNPVF